MVPGGAVMKFRLKALQRMREPDELDSPTLLASPRGWIATFVVLIVVVAAGVWSFVGRLPVTVTAKGLLTHPAGTAQLQSPYTGTVRTMMVSPGLRVVRGQAVAEVLRADGTVRTVSSPFSGEVVTTSASEGAMVREGDGLLAMERTDAPRDRLVAMLFVPGDHALGIAPGRTVDLAVSDAPPGVFGLLRGRVTSISPYPLMAEGVAALVGGDLAARGYLTAEPPRLVVVDLLPDPRTISGYSWTTETGPPMELRSQVTVTGTVTLGSQTPFNLLLGR
ncbi:HlyD family efflux transporter periplasmic adaptor subunit [Microbispora sp. SCL1-1]|nr:HlyD family efflux transporter periplasmic adaptor subunit [Microbispora sp. SCL1-1]